MTPAGLAGHLTALGWRPSTGPGPDDPDGVLMLWHPCFRYAYPYRQRDEALSRVWEELASVVSCDVEDVPLAMATTTHEHVLFCGQLRLQASEGRL